MLINKDKSGYIECPDYPNENWTGDSESYYLVDSNTEMAAVVREHFPKIDFQLDDEGNLIAVTPSLPELSEVIEEKAAEFEKVSSSVIDAGMDIELSDGTVRRFTFTEKDQSDLTGVAIGLMTGEDPISWHSGDKTKPCEFFSAADGWKIIGTLKLYRSYHVTYCRDLCIYVSTLASAEEVEAVEYGFALPEEAKSEVLKNYEQQLGISV